VKIKESKTIHDPTQYTALENCWLRIICPIRDNGIANDSPTETTSGVVKRIAYAPA
jgi:hypothetical protein